MLSVALTTSTNCSGWPGIEPLEVPGLTVEDARQNDHRGIHWTPLNIGDLVFGDPDGIVDVPKDLIGTTISRALDKVCTENTVRHELPDGATLSDVFACHRIL